MTGKWKSKPKKVIETSLGKAPKEEKGPDLSHLRKPIKTSVHGLNQIFALFQSATTEVQAYVSQECDILYECKVCRTIFRSLANFILHKREYCKEKWNPMGGGSEGGFVVSDDVKSDESRSTSPIEKTEIPAKKSDKKELSPIIEKLVEKQKIQILVQNVLSEDLSTKNEEDDDVIFVSEHINDVTLEKIDGNKSAVFQTGVKKSSIDVKESMKAEVLEIHDIVDNNQAVLDIDGKIFKHNIPLHNLTCTECNFTFSTEKTLTHHIKYKHNKTCLVFPCPVCKETFSNAWSVYRHLYKVHRRTTTQIRRMRPLIHNNGIRRDQEPEKKKRKASADEEMSEENQWMNNVEGDQDFQMCGGCGKRFERKAALQSHSQTCTKRIALCNSIKKTETRKPLEKSPDMRQMKGAAKRKQNLSAIVKNLSIEEVTCEKSDVSVPKSGSIDPLKLDDVTITRHVHDDAEEEAAGLPEFEIFTVCEDDDVSEKRHLWDVDADNVNISNEFKEYVNDEDDNCFLTKTMTYVDKNKLMCVPCDSVFMSLYVLLRHMSLHFSWYRYQCSKCNFMSFHKYDCTTHAFDSHSTPNNLMESTVLPIPKWKVLCTSHDFCELSDSNNGMPVLETIEEKTETIVLDDDEMPDICSENGNDVISSDEEIKEKKKKSKASPTLANHRPIRNRIRSVKTVQNDFIYDLNCMMKLNDCFKNKRVKKTVSKP